mgnify:CR=1 FL=1
MIKFFRKIRQNLLSEGKTGKYFKYAIGEILLVVIGILIALSINNWNETNKLKKIEEKVLNNIKNDLVQNKQDLLKNVKRHEFQISEFNILINNIEITQIYNDSLVPKFRNLISWSSPYLTLASYENLKTDKGIDLILNDSLKKKLVHLHETTFKTFIGDIEREEWIHTETISRPAMYKYFILNDSGNLVPKDYAELIEDKDFLSILRFTKNLRAISLRATKRSVNEIQIVIDAISKELEK